VWDARQDLAACFTCKQVGLGFSSLTLKLVEARLRVVDVASSRKSRGVEDEDGWVDATCCVRPFYPKITVFIILDPKSIVVF
jgi:hypothetical protein